MVIVEGPDREGDLVHFDFVKMASLREHSCQFIATYVFLFCEGKQDVEVGSWRRGRGLFRREV